MTLSIAAAPRHDRVLNVARMQVANRMTFIWIPLIVLGAVFLFSVIIWAMIPSGGPKYTAGAQALMWYFAAIGIQSLTQTFPFSQAMSVTRREFFLGTYLAAAASAAILALVCVVGGLLEEATDGWGMNGYMFHIDWMWDAGPGGALLAVFAVSMFTFTCGFWGAIIHRRFGALGLTLTLVAIGLGLLALVWTITRLGVWIALFAWLGSAGVLALALGLVVLVAVMATGSYFVLRRLVV